MAVDTTSTNILVIYLSTVQNQITRTLAVVLVLGLIGNLMSYAVFRQKRLRSNPVALLFAASSIFNIIVLVYGIGTSLYIVDHTNPETYSTVFCKLRLYVRHIFLMIVRTYITLACISCYIITSSKTNLRSLCQPRYVKRIIIIVPFTWPLIAFHMPLWNIVQNNKCINVPSYVLPFGIYFFLVVGVFPLLLMVLFIGLTIRNLRFLHLRIQSSLAVSQRIKSRDRHFIRMLLALVIMYIITNLFFPTNTLYVAATYWFIKSPERISIESLVYSVTSNYILYINNVSPFFLFFSSSAAFRQSVRRCLLECKNFCFHRSHQVQPLRTAIAITTRKGM